MSEVTRLSDFDSLPIEEEITQLRARAVSAENRLHRVIDITSDAVANLQEGPAQRSSAVFAAYLSLVEAVAKEEV